ncbi:hypothetical protein EDF66_101711 [Sphingobacterium sp. JUb20]|nr:hypothetical protein [Sphingobacterium sp. JUb21]TCR10896.1 hypothetical protein EDF66_101711 [Sphingobacterium sp. JUb20]
MFSIGIIVIYFGWGGFIAMVLYGVLLAILDKYVYAKNDHEAVCLQVIP